MLSDEQAFWFVVGLFGLIGVISLWCYGWWGLLQISVFSAVVVGNSVWHWTDNGYLATVWGGGMAALATLFVNWLLSFSRERFRARQ